MKKIFSALLLLPIMAAAFVACSSEDDITTDPEQPADKPITFIASIDQQTRVSYSDESNTLHSKWDANDNGNTVKFISSSGGDPYEFTIGNITDGSTATLTYNNKNGKFPDEFTGTVIYEVGAPAVPTQTANGSTDHLHYGTMLEATLTKATENQPIEFSHVETSFFRVTLNAPEGGVQSGEELVVKANGMEIGRVGFEFTEPVAAGSPLTAYVRCATQQKATELGYSIIKNDKAYSYKSDFNGKTHNIKGGKYYYIDLTAKTPTERNKDVDAVFGKAPDDVVPVDVGTVLEEDDEYQYKLMISDRYLGVTTPYKAVINEEYNMLTSAEGGSGCLYFYWGDVVGHRVDPTTHQLVLKDGETLTMGNSWSVFGNNPFGHIREENKTRETVLQALLDANYIKTESKDICFDGYTLTEEHDAVVQQWGGGWRMLGIREAEAINNWCKYGSVFFRYNTECPSHNCTQNDFTQGRLGGYRLREKNAISISESNMATFPATGGVGKTQLAQAWEAHGKDQPIQAVFWSRDYCYSPNLTSDKYYRGIAYLFGLTQSSGNYNLFKWCFSRNPIETAFGDLGYPILPCLIVKVKKQNASNGN